MQNAYRGFEKFCFIYVDDIFVYSDTEERHYIHVTAVLQRTKQLGIIFSEKKAQLFKTKINFLGLEVEQGSHTHQNHILEKLHEFPNVLTDKKQLQRFLGVLTYAGAYIEKLANLRKNLQVKLKKDSIWNWNEKDTDCIISIKKKLKEFPKLYLPAPEDQMIIETDASDHSWGGVLKAKTPLGEELICRYCSGGFQPAELNYHIGEKEILAVIKTIVKLSIYLTPVNFLIRSDNKNLGHFIRNKITGDRAHGRLIRWQMFFSRYCFTVEHISGEANVLADCLTREFSEKKAN